METVKIRCKQPGLIFRKANPKFEIKFEDDKPIDVEKHIADELLKNPIIELVAEKEEKRGKK